MFVRRGGLLAVAAVSILLGFAGPGLAEKRVALVIGNSAYRHVAALPNTANDAAAIAVMFKTAGYDMVELKRDLGINDLRRAVREFSEASQDADTAVLFYAGHGMEVDGNNYLIPVDAKLASDLDVEDEAISLDRLLKAIEPARRLRFVILDACRDNPFAKTMKRSIAARSIGRGLAKVEPTTTDTLIAFAAKAGSTAADGDSSNSPFTTALLRHLATPGLDLRLALGRVRDDVLAATKRQQEPFVYGSLGGATVAIVPGTAASEPPGRAAAPTAADPDAQARRDFDLANMVGTVQAWDAFLARYNTGFFADLARQQRAKVVAASQQPQSRPAETGPAVSALTPAPVDRPAASRSLGGFAGLTIEVEISEAMREVQPHPAIREVRRTISVYVKDANELPTRINVLGMASRVSRNYSFVGALDANDGRVVSWSIKDNQLTGLIRNTSFSWRPAIRLTGTTCAATVTYQPAPGQTEYRMTRINNNEEMTVASITPQKITCKVSQGDQVSGRAN